MIRRAVVFLMTLVILGIAFSSCEVAPYAVPPTTLGDDKAPTAGPSSPPTTDDDIPIEVRDAAHGDLTRKIDEAKRLLRPVRMHTFRIGGNDAVIAVWNPAAKGPITLVRMANGLSQTKGFDVSVRRANGVNSHYRVNSPAGYVTLAIKTNVRGTIPPRGPTEAVYVPYSEELRTRELVHAGLEYLHALVASGADKLDERDVRSMVDPDRKATETVPAKILTTLLVVEHVDPDEFDAKGVDYSVGKVLAMLGMNRGESFRYAVSFAGARGIAQFIPSTYEITRARYPRAGLPKSFVDGMTDHGSAVMAQYCLADWSLTKLPGRTLRTLNASDRQEDLGAYLAAAYNGGEDRAARVLAGDPAHWEEAGHGLATETVKYIVIFRAVYKRLYP